MKQILRPFPVILLLATLLTGSCKKEYFDLKRLSTEVELTPQLVAPLVYGSLSMTDVMEIFDSIDYVGEFDDNLIYFAYNDTVASYTADTSVSLPVLETVVEYQESDPDFNIFLPVPVGDTFYVPRRVETLDYYLEGDNRVDHVLVKGGTISVDLTSSFKHEGILTVSSEQIFDANGDPYSSTIIIDKSDGSYSGMEEIPSDGFRIVPIYRNDSNIIEMNFDLALINSGNPISPGESANVRSGLNDMGFYEIYGFLDAGDELEQSGSLDIPLWENNPDLKSITFADPRFGITMASSFGIPFRVDLDSIVAYGSEGEELPLVLEGGNILDFRAPGLDQKGETVVTEYQFDRTNSNIDQILALAPSKITYDVAGATSTTGDDTTHFVLDISHVDLVLEFLLPLDFKSTGFALTDTFEFSISEDGVDTSLVKNAEMTITTVNELPVELMLQALFLDENYQVIDSVFDDNRPILGASEVDASTGNLIEATEEVNTVEFPASKLGKLNQVAYLQLRARVLTSGNGEPFVKIYSYYSLNYKVSMLANFRINTSEQ